jgi:hypothetical protein
MLVPVFVFPIQLFLCREVGLGIAFWLTGWRPGAWWVVEWFLTPGRVRTVNNEIALDSSRRWPSVMRSEGHDAWIAYLIRAGSDLTERGR